MQLKNIFYNLEIWLIDYQCMSSEMCITWIEKLIHSISNTQVIFMYQK